VKPKYLFFFSVAIFLMGCGLVLAALWPSHYEVIERDFPQDVQVGDATLTLPGFQLIFRYTPSMKVGVTDSYQLQLVRVAGGANSVLPNIWSRYKVELVTRLEMNDPGFVVEPLGQIHTPWQAGYDVSITWNVRPDRATQSEVTLWVYLDMTQPSAQDVITIPLFAIKLDLQAASICGMRAELAIVMGGIGIFLAILVTAFGIFLRQKNISNQKKRQKRAYSPSEKKKGD
jgi:hypothetical protein